LFLISPKKEPVEHISICKFDWFH